MVSMIESNPGYDEKKIKAHLQYVKGKAAKKSPSKDDEEMGENDDIAVIKREPLTQSNEAISSDEEASLDSREGIVPFCSLFAYFSGLHCVG